jgi:hypothetical protein
MRQINLDENVALLETGVEFRGVLQRAAKHQGAHSITARGWKQ